MSPDDADKPAGDQRVDQQAAEREPTTEHELFIVEGESAADAIVQVCRPETQHVHAIQGKPMNVVRASSKTVWANDRVNDLYRRVIGSPSAKFLPDYIWYRRVILVTDANVDGVHAKALLLALIAEVMPEIVDEGRLFTVRAPEFAVTCAERTDPIFAYSAEGRQSVLSQLADRGATKLATQHYAGLAGMSSHELARAFTNPDTRRLSSLDRDHVSVARAALA
jgi:DNA gyrase/topoisomerase IV subunit B